MTRILLATLAVLFLSAGAGEAQTNFSEPPNAPRRLWVNAPEPISEPKEKAKSLQDLTDAAQGYAKKQSPEAAKVTRDTYTRSYYDIVPKRQRNGGTIMAKPQSRLE